MLLIERREIKIEKCSFIDQTSSRHLSFLTVTLLFLSYGFLSFNCLLSDVLCLQEIYQLQSILCQSTYGLRSILNIQSYTEKKQV